MSPLPGSQPPAKKSPRGAGGRSQTEDFTFFIARRDRSTRDIADGGPPTPESCRAAASDEKATRRTRSSSAIEAAKYGERDEFNQPRPARIKPAQACQ